MGRRFEKKLDARTVATTQRPGRHSDGGCLYLSIDSNGRRRWVFMYNRYGKRTELGLGSARDLSLADARMIAAEMRSVLAKRGDPKAERDKNVAVKTFGQCADAYIEAMRPSWHNPKHAAQWEMTLKDYAAPIRKMRVDGIETRHILDVLKPLWQEKPETAKRLRGRIERVLDAAKVKGQRSGENPARWRGHLDKLLPKQDPLSRGHHKALPFPELPAFMESLRERSATAALALEFTILTAARTSEVLEAEWSEIDLDKKLWTIPALRMKARREHRVPLSARAMAILNELDKTMPYVFPGPKPKSPLSSMAMSMLLRRMESDVTVHGFRSTFRDWASETTGFPHEVCEMALAHVIGNKAEAAYRRGDLFDKRRTLMEAWAGYCEQASSGKVIAMRAS